MTSPRDGGGDARGVAVLVGGLGLLGVVAGVLWSRVVTTPLVTRDESGLVTEGIELGRRAGADAWFAIIGAGFGLVAGVLMTLWATRRGRRDPVVTVLSLLAGALLASVLCSLVGHALGPPDPASVLQGAEEGARAPEMLTTHTWVVHLVWPLATSTGALLTLLLHPPRVRGPGRSDTLPGSSPP